MAPASDVGLTLRAKRAEEGKGKEAEEALEQMRLALKKVSLLPLHELERTEHPELTSICFPPIRSSQEADEE